MKIFLKKILLFLFINVSVIFLLLFYIDKRDRKQNFKQWETESVLYSIQENMLYDILIIGSSHGRMFVRGKNHLSIEKILNKKIINISKSAAGPIPEFEFLKYFYKKNNSVKEIWYFIDPFVFYSDKWNEDLYYLTDEPFRFDFFFQIFFSNLTTDIKYNYIKSKFQNDWKKYNSTRIPDTEEKLLKIDKNALTKRMKTEYPSGLKKENFIKYSEYFNKLIAYAKQKNTNIIFIIPPTLLGKIPGMNEMKIYLNDCKNNFNINNYDFADSLLEPHFYYNHDHLNNNGVDFFTREYLSKIK